MTTETQIELMRAICSIAERAYRRGFHHGCASGTCEQEAADFRFHHLTQEEEQTGHLRHATFPPWDGQPARPLTSGFSTLERVEIEAIRYPVLRDFFATIRDRF